jgi:hypothetical protein
MTGDVFSPVTHGRGKNKNVTLPTNAPMDFALRYRGAGNIFGSADDVFYRLSDSPNYASQYCFDPIRPYASSDPARLDFARLILAWDTNRDGIRDLRMMLQVRHHSGGMHFVAPDIVAPVPAPAALWLLGSGFTGLFAFLRRAKQS